MVADFDGALAIARAIPDDGHRVGALRGIARAQAKAGDFDGALTTTRDISNAIWRAPTLSEIAQEQAKAGDIAGEGAATTRAYRCGCLQSSAPAHIRCE